MPQTRRVQNDADTPTLLDYFTWLRRRWWILLGVAVLGTAASFAVTLLQTPVYTATTSVLVKQIGPDANPNAKVNLDTEAQVIRSLVVANRAQAIMNTSESPTSLLNSVNVTVPPNSQVMLVSFDASTPERARDGSHAFTQAYLDLRVDTARRSLDSEAAALRQQIEELDRQLALVAGKIAALPANSVDRQRAESDRDVLTNQITSLNNRLSPLVATNLDPGSIISDASAPSKPSSPNRFLNLVSGFGGGLLLGIALALLVDRLDTRVRRARDVSDRAGVPVLLSMPDKVMLPELLPGTSPTSREIGRLRNVLLTNVADPAPGVQGRRLLIASASQGMAAGYFAANLAAAYARSGRQVALVTTNVDSPIARMLGVEAEQGLADALRHDVSALNALTSVPGVPQLRVLPPGRLDRETELPVTRLWDIVNELSARFDHVLVETAPPAVAVEAQALASHVEAVLIVTEMRRTRTREITAALRQFEQVDAPVIGAVLVGPVGASFTVDHSQPGATNGKGPTLDGVGRVEFATVAADQAGSGTVTGKGVAVAVPMATESTIVLPRISEAGLGIASSGAGAADSKRSRKPGGAGAQRGSAYRTRNGGVGGSWSPSQLDSDEK